jgi:ketosteroid isomerase-like protein
MRGEGPVASPEALAKIDAAGAKTALLDADRAFSALSALKGAKEAYLAWVSDDLRIYRRDALPGHGRDEMMAALPASPAVLTWQPIAGVVSASGDLGYTYGMAALKQSADQTMGTKGDEFTYVRIWRKQGNGGWKVALDLLNPLPPPPAAKPGN